jgi:hypothetical protein
LQLPHCRVAHMQLPLYKVAHQCQRYCIIQLSAHQLVSYECTTSKPAKLLLPVPWGWSLHPCSYAY